MGLFFVARPRCRAPRARPGPGFRYSGHEDSAAFPAPTPLLALAGCCANTSCNCTGYRWPTLST
ncbi:MAG: hypothetical protein WKG07_42955 [Hymenobacter sp.]